MKPAQARVFLHGVVLDAVREDIRENGKLNVHYYEALKRSLYKPGAFFKGIIFPLLDVSAEVKREASLYSTSLCVDRLHAERSCHYRFGTGEGESTSRTLRRCDPPPRKHGLFRTKLTIYASPSRQKIRVTI